MNKHEYSKRVAWCAQAPRHIQCTPELISVGFLSASSLTTHFRLRESAKISLQLCFWASQDPSPDAHLIRQWLVVLHQGYLEIGVNLDLK